MLLATAGIWLVAAAAAAFNCVVEQRIDAKMARTAWRPTAKGELTNTQTLLFSATFSKEVVRLSSDFTHDPGRVDDLRLLVDQAAVLPDGPDPQPGRVEGDVVVGDGQPFDGEEDVAVA